MARPAKTEVAALNIRIPSDHPRNYSELIQTIADLKRGISVHGDHFVAISSYFPDQRAGILSKYTEIDLDGDWFNIEDFEPADQKELDQINVPKNLKPNLSQFYFFIDENLHCVVFETYADSSSVSSRTIEKYFRLAVGIDEVVAKYGRVQVDVVKSYQEVERLLDLPDLKEIRFEIGRPNEDDLTTSLAAVIEERLAEQNSDTYIETLKSGAGKAITPNERSRALGTVAAENGRVYARSIENGLLKSHDTDETPLKEVDTFGPDVGRLVKFKKLVEKILDRIRQARK